MAWLERVPYLTTKLSTDTNTTAFSQQYVSSMYWSLTALMKTPWVGPDTVSEKIYASLIVVVGATLFAMLLGSVTLHGAPTSHPTGPHPLFAMLLGSVTLHGAPTSRDPTPRHPTPRDPTPAPQPTGPHPSPWYRTVDVPGNGDDQHI